MTPGLSYRRWGAGPTVVLLHGFAGGAALWTGLGERLAPRFDVVAPDLPGFAASAGHAVPPTMAGFAAAVVDLLDELEVRRFALLGHSMGGVIAQQLALDFPDRVQRLVIYAARSYIGAAGRHETFDQTVAQFTGGNLEAVVRRQVAAWFAAGADDPEYETCCAVAKAMTADAALAAMGAAMGCDHRDGLAKLAMPVLIIGGDRDRMLGVAHMGWQRDTIPDALLCILPGRGHMAHLEDPAGFHQAIEGFLGESE